MVGCGIEVVVGRNGRGRSRVGEEGGCWSEGEVGRVIRTCFTLSYYCKYLQLILLCHYTILTFKEENEKESGNGESG